MYAKTNQTTRINKQSLLDLGNSSKSISTAHTLWPENFKVYKEFKPCKPVVTSSSQDPLGVVTESSGRGFREGLINLTTANPATLNFLVTIFMAAHCGTRGGGFAQSRPWAAFSRPTWENFTFCQLLPAFFPIFPNVDYLIHASARVCALLQLGHVFRLVRLTRCTHTSNFLPFSKFFFST